MSRPPILTSSCKMSVLLFLSDHWRAQTPSVCSSEIIYLGRGTGGTGNESLTFLVKHLTFDLLTRIARQAASNGVLPQKTRAFFSLLPLRTTTTRRQPPTDTVSTPGSRRWVRLTLIFSRSNYRLLLGRTEPLALLSIHTPTPGIVATRHLLTVGAHCLSTGSARV